MEIAFVSQCGVRGSRLVIQPNITLEIGAPIREVVDALKVRGVSIQVLHDKTTSENDLHVVVTQDGICLRFDSRLIDCALFVLLCHLNA